MAQGKTYRVKEVSELARISVRTLHHYDAIGLLCPASRSPAGYRLYSDADLLRLHQIALHRVLGFSLSETQRILDDPEFDLTISLVRQKAKLLAQRAKTDAMIDSIDQALESIQLRSNEMMLSANLFDGFRPEDYEQEAKDRWGETEIYRISRERTATYGEEDWVELKEEAAEIYRHIAAAMQNGHSPMSSAVASLAERHRLHIDRWFYPCDLNQHRKLADLYEGDSRFSQNIDKYGKGVARFLCAAIRAQ